MNNLYHKVAVTSVCTALSFTLGVNKEAKAATLTLTPTSAFYSFEFGAPKSGEGDGYFVGEALLAGTQMLSRHKELGVEFRALYEFNIPNLSLAPNTIISSAIFQARVVNVSWYFHYWLQVYGYRGDGEKSATDHGSGEYLLEEKPFSWFIMERKPREILNFDVLSFINQKISNNDAFVGFNIRAQTDPRLDSTGYISLDPNASLIIKTAEPVPEPTTIFGSALGLCLGGWLKRQESSQQNKTTPQG
jgi:hypothetical protein